VLLLSMTASVATADDDGLIRAIVVTALQFQLNS
jgi:hypothetical protein